MTQGIRDLTVVRDRYSVQNGFSIRANSMLALKHESYSEFVQWLIHARNETFLLKFTIGLGVFALIAVLAVVAARWSR